MAEPRLPRQHWEALGPPEPGPPQLWPLTELLPLGKLLLEMLVQSVQLPPSLAPPQTSSQPVPVVYHVYTFRGIRQVCEVRALPTAGLAGLEDPPTGDSLVSQALSLRPHLVLSWHLSMGGVGWGLIACLSRSPRLAS